MRILHVIRSVNPKDGGPIEGLLQRGEALKEMGIVPEILSADDPSADYVRNCSLKVHAVGPAPGIYGRCPAMTEWLRKRRLDFDLVTAHGIWQFPPVAVRNALKGTSTPYFVFVHGMLDPWFDLDKAKRLKKQVYWLTNLGAVMRDARFVMFTTEEERRLAHNRFLPYKVTERVVAYGTNGLTIDAEVAREHFESAFPQLAGKRFLLFLSRIHQKKGCDLLVQAFAQVYGSDREMHLALAGPDQVGWQADLEAIVKQAGVADRVHFLGMVGGEKKWGAFASADAFVLPSHQENFGIVVAEALSAKCPVLISNKVNIWREVLDGGGGLVAPDDLAGTINLLTRWKSISDSEKDSMREAARATFEKNFSAMQSAVSLMEAAKIAMATK
ncbi:MAG: glycosyltransferase [Fimbriimonadaceae bacterium]|nr:glycosyltransferase [Fimbriimonadaceae bacterium]